MSMWLRDESATTICTYYDQIATIITCCPNVVATAMIPQIFHRSSMYMQWY